MTIGLDPYRNHMRGHLLAIDIGRKNMTHCLFLIKKSIEIPLFFTISICQLWKKRCRILTAKMQEFLLYFLPCISKLVSGPDLIAETAKRIEEITTKLHSTTDADQKKQRDSAAELLSSLDAYYEQNHGTLSTQIYENIIRK